jgi:hypothetical protein
VLVPHTVYHTEYKKVPVVTTHVEYDSVPYKKADVKYDQEIVEVTHNITTTVYTPEYKVARPTRTWNPLPHCVCVCACVCARARVRVCADIMPE